MWDVFLSVKFSDIRNAVNAFILLFPIVVKPLRNLLGSPFGLRTRPPHDHASGGVPYPSRAPRFAHSGRRSAARPVPTELPLTRCRLCWMLLTVSMGGARLGMRILIPTYQIDKTDNLRQDLAARVEHVESVWLHIHPC